MGRNRFMNFENRKKIEELYGQSMAVAEIAACVGFNRASVYDELKRGFTGEMDKNGRPEYSAELAQRKVFECRRQQLVAAE